MHSLRLLKESVEREVCVAGQSKVLQCEREHVLPPLLLVGRLGQLLQAEADVQDAVDEHQVRLLSNLKIPNSVIVSRKIRLFNVTSKEVKRMLALKRLRLSSTMSSSLAVIVGGAGPLPVPLAVILSGRTGTLPMNFLPSAGMAEW